MGEFKTNSITSKEEPTPNVPKRKITPVADSSTKPTGSIFNALIDKFVHRDRESIRSFVIETVVVPGIVSAITGIGDIIIDSLTEGVGVVFKSFGFNSDERGGYSSRNGRTMYSSISSGRSRRRRGRDRDDEYEDMEERMTYDNVRVETRGKAEKVIHELREIIAEDGYATVGQLFELVKQIPDYTDHQYGWTKLDSADWVRTRDVNYPYLLKFPKPRRLDDILK